MSSSSNNSTQPVDGAEYEQSDILNQDHSDFDNLDRETEPDIAEFTSGLERPVAPITHEQLQRAEVIAALDQDIPDPKTAARLGSYPEIRDVATETLRRSDLLPYTFRIQGKAHSLDDYPQFRNMFDVPYIPRTLYMCGRQLGKSSGTSRSEILDTIQVNNFHILYVAPLQAQANYYSTTYLDEAIKSAYIARWLQSKDSASAEYKAVSSVGHYSFNNGSSVRLSYAKTSPDRARGIYADRIDYDEIQDQLIDNLGVIDQSLSASDYGVRRYTGTAKTTDNTIEFLWQQSSQAEWAMKCGSCNHWNVPDKEHALDMIQVQGPTCVNCGSKLNVRNGDWVPKFRERHKLFAGYHVPQIVVPAIVENDNRWMQLIQKVLTTSPTQVMQEILGISCSTGARLITEEDIKRNSVLPTLRRMQDPDWKNRYARIIGGVDWGVAELSSFTVHTIIGQRPDGSIDVLWGKRFVGFDPSTYLREIAQAQAYYGAEMLCSDFGMGFEKNLILQKQYGVSVVQFQYTDAGKSLTYSPVGPLPRWILDKVSSMEILFWAIKANQVRFPPFEEFNRLSMDLLSPYEEIVVFQGRETRRFQRNPARPDDFCHALNFAYAGMKALSGQSMLDGIPDSAIGATLTPDLSSAPEPDRIDPLQNLRTLT